MRNGEIGAGNETRTRDPNLGKVVLYQLSYSRSDLGGVASSTAAYSTDSAGAVNRFSAFLLFSRGLDLLRVSISTTQRGAPKG